MWTDDSSRGGHDRRRITTSARQVPGGGWFAGQCAWSSSEAAFLVSVGTFETIDAVGDPNVSNAKEKLGEFEQQIAAVGTPKSVAGIGDGAILGESGMAAYKGEIYIEVVNLRLTEEQMIEIVKLSANRL